jgi:hypothetical protein
MVRGLNHPAGEGLTDLSGGYRRVQLPLTSPGSRDL